MATNESSIPVIDFEPFLNGTNCQAVGDAIVDALKRYASLQLINHGLPQQQVDDVMKKARHFFELSLDIKSQSARPPFNGADPASGYMATGVESNYQLNDNPPTEIRESMDFILDDLPLAECSEAKIFLTEFQRFYKSAHQLTLNFLEAVSLGFHLSPQKHDEFMTAHTHIGEIKHNCTLLRAAYYPSFTLDNYQQQHTRINPHTDYGTFSFNFQDDVGGLEVDANLGCYVPVQPTDGAVSVVIGDVMEYWTGGVLKATKHQVVVPDKKAGSQPRQSIIFFVDPDNEADLLSLLESSEKIKEKNGRSIKARDIVMPRFQMHLGDR